MTTDDRWADETFDGSLVRAHDLFTWLAMQRVAPLLSRFGLGAADHAHLRMVAREYLAMYTDLDLDSGSDPEAQFWRALVAIEQHDGPHARTIVDTWHAIGISDESAYSRAMMAWADVLQDAAFDSGISVGDPWFTATRRVSQSHLAADRWHDAVGAASEPADGWEIDYYVMWDRVVGHGTSPIAGIRQTLEFTDVHDAWLDLRAALPDESVQALRAWAQRRAPRYLTFGKLPIPERDGWEDWLELRRRTGAIE
jgi:hypothetical protein